MNRKFLYLIMVIVLIIAISIGIFVSTNKRNNENTNNINISNENATIQESNNKENNQKITTNSNILKSISANVYTPANFDETNQYPAVVVAHPNGGVKEQVAGLYSQKLAELGYITMAY